MMLIFVVLFLLISFVCFTIAYYFKNYFWAAVALIILFGFAVGITLDGIDIPTIDNVVVNTVNDSYTTATIQTEYVNYKNIYTNTVSGSLLFLCVFFFYDIMNKRNGK